MIEGYTHTTNASGYPVPLGEPVTFTDAKAALVAAIGEEQWLVVKDRDCSGPGYTQTVEQLLHLSE